jgi:hypothetical protein
VELALSSAPEPHDGATPELNAYIEAVYQFAETLTGDAARAATLTERVFAGAKADLEAPLGADEVRDRLLARCALLFSAAGSLSQHTSPAPSAHSLHSSLARLPWDQRAAVALVDQLGLPYAAAATVLGACLADFRALLRGGRSALFAAYSSGASMIGQVGA